MPHEKYYDIKAYERKSGQHDAMQARHSAKYSDNNFDDFEGTDLLKEDQVKDDITAYHNYINIYNYRYGHSYY